MAVRSALPSPSALAAMAALGAIGSVFVLKYGAEVSPLAGPGSVLFVVAYVAAVAMAVVLTSRWADVRTRSLGIGLGAGLLLTTAALALIAPEANDVARLPALAVWLERLFDGVYPYGLPIRPSGFPVLFAVALPFWATGLLALLPVLGLLAFLGTLRTVPPASWLPALVGLALLPSFHYEVVVHSELFLNSALALASLGVFEWARRRGHGELVLAAVLAGLILSTRLYVGAVYAVYGAYAFRSEWGRGAVFAGVAFAVWAGTWLLFLWWDAERFAAFGPFAVQGLYLPRWTIGVGILIALGLGWRAPDLRAVVARAGWLLFGLVVLSGLWTIDFSVPLARFEGFDVAYLVVPTPFLLLALAGRRLRDEATQMQEDELSSALAPAAPTPDLA